MASSMPLTMQRKRDRTQITSSVNCIAIPRSTLPKNFNSNHFLEHINNKKSAHVQRASGHEFSVAHYTGKVTYDARDLSDKNRDFIPPEMVSNWEVIQVLKTDNMISFTINGSK